MKRSEVEALKPGAAVEVLVVDDQDRDRWERAVLVKPSARLVRWRGEEWVVPLDEVRIPPPRSAGPCSCGDCVACEFRQTRALVRARRAA